MVLLQRWARGLQVACCARALFLVIVVVTAVSAIPSRECKWVVEKSIKEYNGKRKCHTAPCGALSVPMWGSTFLDRMGTECKDLMVSYRNRDTSVLGLRSSMNRKCSTSRDSASPTNPVIVEASGIKNFMICTVPKVACSNFRKLLNVIIRHPDSSPEDIWEVIKDAHFDFYPSLWHYRHESTLRADVYPSFIIGRNPYVRVLSGFLNKMVITEGMEDWWTMKSTNDALGRYPNDKPWQPTVQGFHNFMHKLYAHGAENINQHFQVQMYTCGADLEFEYHLRLEDMYKWFPCWMQGLRLRTFTERGWTKTPHGKLYIGANPGHSAEELAKSECWWSPPGISCEEYYKMMVGASGDIIPLQQEVDASSVRKNDDHDTGAAARWQEFYTQEIGDMVYELYKLDFERFGYSREFFT